MRQDPPLRSLRRAGRLPTAGAGKAVHAPCSSRHGSENRGEGCRPLRLFVPIWPQRHVLLGEKAVCDVIQKDPEAGSCCAEGLLTSETVTGRERRREQPRAQEQAPGPEKPEGQEGPSPGAYRKDPSCPHLDLRLAASRTRRQSSQRVATTGRQECLWGAAGSSLGRGQGGWMAAAGGLSACPLLP